MSLNSAAEELFGTLVQRHGFLTCVLETDGPTLKRTLADRTGLSQPTVNKALIELRDWDLIESGDDGIVPTSIGILVWEPYRAYERCLAGVVTPGNHGSRWTTDASRRDAMRLVADRRSVIECVETTTRDKRDLVANLDASRSTVNRAVRDLETAGILHRTADGYTVTADGQRVVDRYWSAIATLADILDARDVLVSLPPDDRLRSAMVSDATTEESVDAPPYHLPAGVRERIVTAERVRLSLPALAAPQLLDCCLQQVVRHDVPVELLASQSLLDSITEEFPGPLTTMAAERNPFSAWVPEPESAHVPPFGVVLTEAETTTVTVIAYDEDRTISGVIQTAADDAVRWAEECYTRTFDETVEVTDDLRGLTPATMATGMGLPRTGDAERIARETEAFVRLTPDYFARRDPMSPTTAWRTGFDLVDVHAGYAIDREGTRDEDRFNLTDDLVRSLYRGTDHVLLGSPGSGKSTVCKSVACRWYEQGLGPVFYRGSDTDVMFDSPAVIREQLRTASADGHVLVVVEDAVRMEASDIFRVMKAFRGTDAVTFLLDAREGEWEDPESLPTDAGLEAYRREAIETVSVPPLDDIERERFVRRFELVTGHDVGRAVRRGLDGTTSGGTSGAEQSPPSTRPGEPLLLVHRLVTHADPFTVYDAETPTTFVETVQRALETLPDDGLVLDVSILLMLLDLSGVGVHPALVYALADDEGDIEAVREAFLKLDGRLVFETDPSTDAEAAPYRTIHGAWSALFLDQYLETTTDHAASRRAGRCLTAVLRVADDEKKRERLATVLNVDTTILDRIGSDPGKWADTTVERFFAAGRRRPGLAPLFGRTDDSFFELPAVCSSSMAADCTLWRAQMARETGALDRADDEYEALTPHVSDADGSEWATKLRGQRFHGHGTIAWQRGDFATAEQQYVRALDHYHEADDRRQCAVTRMNLGLVTMARGDIGTAETAFSRCRDLYRELDDMRGEALALTNLAGIVARTDTLETAIEQYRRALDLSDEFDGHQVRANCLHGIGRAVAHRGNLDSATSYCTQGLEYCRESGIRNVEAYCLAQLGLIRRIRGDLDAAERYHRKSLDIRRKTGDRRGEAWSLTTLGTLACERGAEDVADERCRESNELAREISDRTVEADSLVALGEVARKRGDLDTAAERARTALDRYEPAGNRFGAAKCRRVIGRIARDRGRFPIAERRLRQSLDDFHDMGYRYEAARTTVALGTLARERDAHAEACRHWDAGAKLHRNIGAHRAAVKAYERLSAVHEERGEFDVAIEHCESARTIERGTEFLEPSASLSERLTRLTEHRAAAGDN
ncbi:hypothetical protein A4G99_10655 [Haladaptatus sp. R4]|uniref:tetratricopeptide repeat protein n=1 Tax=Haladaptatus sp. R4 TaxID=1679489 RepID=UPI0007B48368|nr:tetratricopeptide repeat protein [Haladaptatus sp. R4]KZN24784.1 hypothetical protein A4G99_10655 [Haladaptatus sp. R4]